MIGELAELVPLCQPIKLFELSAGTRSLLDRLLLPPLTQIIEGYINELVFLPTLPPLLAHFPWPAEQLVVIFAQGNENPHSPGLL